MIKLSELKGDTKICYIRNNKINILTKDEFLIERQKGKNFFYIFTVRKFNEIITVESILEMFTHYLHDDWNKNMYNSISKDEEKTINNIFNKASQENPIYFTGEEIEIDC